MAAWHVWLKSLGAAIWHEAPKAVLGLIPFGESMARIAEDWWKRLRAAQPPAQDKAALEGLVNASPAEVKAKAAEIAAEIAPPEARNNLALTLELAAPVSRCSLARADDAQGRTVPQALRIDGPLVIGRFIPPAPPRFQEGAAFQGWRLTERLGVGGFAEVWKASHPHDEELTAAVKFFTGDEMRGRLGAHEVAVLKQVRKIGAGRGVVQLLDFDVTADPPWIKFEYVAGGDLTRYASSFSGLRSTALVRRLARIVGACHRLTPPVVHRDIKPGNILMRRDGPLIADFGIGGVSSSLALAQEEASTRLTASLPTILSGSHTSLYASPEQAAGSDPDPRDDVYSLGVLWWQLLMGDLSLPAPMGNWQKRLAALGLGADLIELLGDCLDADRPKDALELAERLDAVPRPEPVPAKPALAWLTHFTCPTVNAPMVLVPPGEFWMGGGNGKCGERHVVMEKPFYLGTYLVTQAQWKHVMGGNPSHFRRNGPGSACSSCRHTRPQRSSATTAPRSSRSLFC